MSRFLELLINPLSHEEPVASQHCGQLRGFIPICDITGNELTILSVYHSTNLISFRAFDKDFGSTDPVVMGVFWPWLYTAYSESNWLHDR